MRAISRRLWSVSLSCFAAGIAVGLAVPVVVSAAGARETVDPDEEYAQLMKERYDLTSEQARTIRMVLQAREREHRNLLSDLERLPTELREKVLQISRHAEERIRIVLTEEQRRRFLRDAEQGAGPTGSERPADDAVDGSTGTGKE